LSLVADTHQPVLERQVDNLRHLEKIAKAMAPDPTDYEYTGEVNDLGDMSGSCACGHPIRYEFIVRNTTGKEVVIGSTCIDTSVPWLTSVGAEKLAQDLREALEANEEAKKEALRKLRDAKNDEEVVLLEQYWDETIMPWWSRARESYYESHKIPWTNWQGETTYRHPFYPKWLYRLPVLKAMSTPGRTASSIRTKIVNLALGSAHDGFAFPQLPNNKKLIAKIAERFKDRREMMERRIERYQKLAADTPHYDGYANAVIEHEAELEAELELQDRFWRQARP
jgi:hypothetical protein